MTSSNFTTTFQVDKSPRQVFNAINNVRGWWSGEIDGDTASVGDEFTYRYQDVHRSTQRLIEVIPDQKVVWLVLDGYLNFVEHKNEWRGTRVVFDIGRKNDKTEVRVTHEGLVPEFECFDACSRGWSFYINSSLRDLITTGKGDPNPKE